MAMYDDYLRAVTGPESGFSRDPNLMNRAGSGARGPFQIMPGTARGLAAQGHNFDMSSVEGQTGAASELTRQNEVLLRTRLGRAPTEPELYFAHGMGGPAAAYLLANPEMPLGVALRTFYGGTRQGEQFADRIRAQNPNLAQRWDRPVTETVADFGTRLQGGRPTAPVPQPRPVIDAASDFDPTVSAMPTLRARAGEQIAQAQAPLPQVPPELPSLAEPAPAPWAGAQPAQPLPAPPAQPFAFSAPGIQPEALPPQPMPRSVAPRNLRDARRREQDRAVGTPPISQTTAQRAIEAGGIALANPGAIPVPAQLPVPPEGASAYLLDRVRAMGAPYMAAYEAYQRNIGRPFSGAVTAAVEGLPDWLRSLGEVDPEAARRLNEAVELNRSRQGDGGPQPYVAGPPPPTVAPPAPPAPAPAPAQLPPIPTLTPTASAPAAAAAAGPEVPGPDYGRILALMEQAANPQRQPARTAREQGWETFLAGLGAGGASQPGDTISSVIGRAGAGTAASRTALNREARQEEERYQQARQEGAGRAAQLGIGVMGQQQQAAISRAELAQRRQQSAAELAQRAAEGDRTAQLTLYRLQLERAVAEARVEQLRNPGRGGSFGTPAQQMVISSLRGRYQERAEREAERIHGANWAGMRLTPEGRAVRDQIADALMMSDPEGQALLTQYQQLLTTRQFAPGTSPTTALE